MHTYLEAKNLNLSIPIFDAARSFRSSLFKCCVGGQIIKNNQDPSSVVSVRALDNINFRLESGDRLGLIGHNGSGKTSLLRVLAGIYFPDSGVIHHNVKITSLFNINIGIDGDDTGLENIFNIGLYLGISKKEILKKKDEIIEFSGLKDFIYLPVRVYSTGMLLRLSFAIVTILEPKILLMDEGFGTGDVDFTQKAKYKLEEFYKNVDILIMASHSDELIKKLCNKALLLENGKIKAYGKVEEVFDVYYKKNKQAVTII